MSLNHPHVDEIQMRRDNDPAYDGRTIWLHWSVAGLIVFMWSLAQVAHRLPKGPFRLGLWSTHLLVGLFLAALVVVRLAWRATRGRRLPASGSGVSRLAAKGAHWALYVISTMVVGLGLLSVSSFPLFGAWTFPTFWSQAVNHSIREWHGLAANILLSLAGLHAVAALYHHYIVKDGLLFRMIRIEGSGKKG